VQTEFYDRLPWFEAFDPFPGERNRSIRNNFKINPLNPEAVQISQAKYAAGAWLGPDVPRKPGHHSRSVGQKRKHRRWHGINS
jgi:hypothetical protein